MPITEHEEEREMNPLEEAEAELADLALNEEGENLELAQAKPEPASPEPTPEPAPAAEEWKPPSKDSFDRVMRARDAFKHKMLEEQRARKEEAAERKKIIEELAEFRKTLQDQAPKPELTPEQQFAADVASQVREPIEERFSRVEKRLEDEDHRRAQSERAQALTQAVSQDFGAIEQARPDFKQALAHLQQHRAAEWQRSNPALDLGEAIASTNQEINQTIVEAISKGVSPGQYLYDMAVSQFGWAAPQAQPAPTNGKPEPTPPRPARPRGGRTLSSVGGKSPAVSMELSREIVDSANDEEFAKLVAKHGMARIESLYASEPS